MSTNTQAPAQPSDEEIEQLATEHLTPYSRYESSNDLWIEGEVEFARALLSRYGAGQPAASADRETLMRSIVQAGQQTGIIRTDLETVSVSECLHILECLSKPAASAEPVARVESWTNGSYHRNYKLTWLEGSGNLERGALLYAAAPVAAQAEPSGDRAILLELMAAFDGETWECPQCGHGEGTKDCDSAIMLREYLVNNPVPAQAQPYSLNLDPAGIRALTADAITGALAMGAQGAEHPPEGHWLKPFYEMGRQAATKAQQPAGCSIAANTEYHLLKENRR